ncbi:MAG: hypothetical protein M1821_007647 [Bathelium mastoideum]|nr:MAG: hypothetical protein M1821_007647 [Bathelium mastoideum]
MSISSPDQFASIWQAAAEGAAKRFEAICGKNLEALDLASLQRVQDLESLVDSKSAEFDEFRKKRGSLFKVIMENVMMPVELLGNLAAGGASVAFPASSLIFGAVSYLIGAAKGVSSAYDQIEDLMSTLQGFTTRLKVYNREKISVELQRNLIAILTTLLEVLALSRKSIKHGRVWGFGKSVALGKDKDVSDAVEKLAQLTRSENLLVGAETHSEVTRQGRIVDGVATTVFSTYSSVENQGALINQMLGESRQMHDEVLEQFADVTYTLNESQAARKQDQEKTSHKKIKQILQPSVNPQDTYTKIMSNRLSGTGDWVHTEALFTSWLNRAFPVLWISGTPGAGKSYLSANVITLLKEQFPQGVQDAAQTSIAYFYFKDNDPEMRSFHRALLDMAFQIAQNDAVYAKYLDTVLESDKEVKSTESAWRKLFSEYFINNENKCSVAYVIMDGIDEAYEDKRSEFFALLRDVKNKNHGFYRIQLAMLGRPHLIDDILEQLDIEQLPTIDVTESKNSEDILSYVKNSVSKSRILRRVSKKLQEEVIETLSTNAKGMFLWVDLMLQELATKSWESAIKDALKKAPKGLSQIIQHLLESFSESLPEEDVEDLNELLTWVTCAKRPLNLGEINVLLKYRSPTGEGVLCLEGKLRRQYASFFVLTREDGLATADLQNLHQNHPAYEGIRVEEDETAAFDEAETAFDSNPRTTEVTFCHASIGDFFRNERHGKIRSGEKQGVGVNINDANASTLRTLLMLWTDCGFAAKVAGDISLYPYAQKFWIQHLRDADITKTSLQMKTSLGPLLVEVCRDEGVVRGWGDTANGWFFWVDENILSVRKWLEDKDIFGSLPQDSQDWIQSTSETPAATFIE